MAESAENPQAPAPALTVDGREDLFGRAGQAAKYALYRPTYPPELYTDMLAALPPQDASQQGRRPFAVDVACGTGQVTMPLAQWFDRVLGVDQSAAQLEHARKPEADAGLGAVSYSAGSAYELTSSAEPGTADLVTIGQAMHWLDLQRFFTATADVLRPGGVLAVMGYGAAELGDERAHAAWRRFYVEVLGSLKKPGEAGCWWECDRALPDTGFDCLDADGFGPRFLPPGAADGGFTRRWYRLPAKQKAGAFFEYIRSMSPYQTIMQKGGIPDPLEPLQKEMGIEDWDQELEVTFPFFLLTARKQQA